MTEVAAEAVAPEEVADPSPAQKAEDAIKLITRALDQGMATGKFPVGMGAIDFHKAVRDALNVVITDLKTIHDPKDEPEPVELKAVPQEG